MMNSSQPYELPSRSFQSMGVHGPSAWGCGRSPMLPSTDPTRIHEREPCCSKESMGVKTAQATWSVRRWSQLERARSTAVPIGPMSRRGRVDWSWATLAAAFGLGFFIRLAKAVTRNVGYSIIASSFLLTRALAFASFDVSPRRHGCGYNVAAALAK